MTLDEAIERRLDEILADWPEDTPEQISAAARILASPRPAKAVTTLRTKTSPRATARRAA